MSSLWKEPSLKEVQQATERINSMGQDELLLLTIWYYYGTSINGGQEYAKVFTILQERLGIPSESEFSGLVSFFFHENVVDGDGGSEFLSPAYRAAFETSLNDARIKDFLSRVILERVPVTEGHQNKQQDIYFDAIARNFEKLPDNVRAQLAESIKSENAINKGYAMIAILWESAHLPAQLVNEVLESLPHVKEDVVKTMVTNIVHSGFDRMPPQVRETAIVKLDYPTRAVGNNFDKLPLDMQRTFKERLISMLCQESANIQGEAIFVIAFFFDKLPSDIQRLLSDAISGQDENLRAIAIKQIPGLLHRLPSDFIRLFGNLANDDRRGVQAALDQALPRLEDSIHEFIRSGTPEGEDRIRTLFEIRHKGLRNSIIKVLKHWSRVGNEGFKERAQKLLKEIKSK